MIKLFVFDLGNVIVPFEHRQIVVKLLKKVKDKIVPSPQECFSFMFDLEEGFVNPYEEGLISSIEFFSTIRDRYGLEMDFEEFKRIWNPIFAHNPEVNEIIQYLKSKDYPVFLLSNTNELHFAYIIKHFPIVHTLDEWILSFEVGAKKPKKRIFDVIFEKMDVAPQEVFYVDDIGQYVEAAKSYGFQGTVFRDAAGLWESIRRSGI
ncbi:MAG TPA: HAD family phosphatase [Syntrophorhabdaceae bacterium]|jgi:putative hydrolase of the HAD superfamily